MNSVTPVDLFLPVATIVSERMPAAVVFENVPAFANSLAGELLVTHLERIGYHVFTTILRPNEEWNELEDRKRWLLVATLDRPFTRGNSSQTLSCFCCRISRDARMLSVTAQTRSELHEPSKGCAHTIFASAKPGHGFQSP
jgi:site-specific DNA-cytosine methylase